MTDLSDKDRVRLLISDVGGASGTDFIFTDNEILNFLSLESDVIYKATAVALRTLAANEAMVSKRIKFLELTTDGPAVAKALKDLADAFDEQAETADGDAGVFQVGHIGGRFPSYDNFPYWIDRD